MSLNNNGKSTPPPQTSDDPITQAILMLEKKQRNLGKRKEKLESYQQEEKSGKELHKDQKEALAKYGEVIGQMECVKDVVEQMKKIQSDVSKNQKRLLKQASEEKRLLVAQRLREYIQLRYLIEHRPTTLKPDESTLLDELTRLIIPADLSMTTVTRSIDTVLSIYQGSSTTMKQLTGRTSQEIRETLEQLQTTTSVSTQETGTPQQSQIIEPIKQTPLIPQVPPTTPASLLPQRNHNSKPSNNNDDVLGPTLSHPPLVQSNLNEYPLHFDTRNQNIPLQEIIQDSPFFSHDLTTTSNQQDSPNNLSTFNSTIPSSHGYSKVSSTQQGVNEYNQESSSSHLSTDEQQSEEQWQYTRSNTGNTQRTNQYNGTTNRNYQRGGSSNNYTQQNWRGARGAGGQYDNSYGTGQRQYNSGQRGGLNSNYRGNRAGNSRGRASNDNGYQKYDQQ